jgi:hypothetical protein
MYDEGFNLNGLMDNAVASPYGEHGMDRGDTNNPAAYRGNVTAADPYPVRQGDGMVGRPQVAYTYGRHYGAAYGDVELELFYDPNDASYLYSYAPATGAITIVKSAKSSAPVTVAAGTQAYNAILSVYKAQAKTGQTTKATGKPEQILATFFASLAKGLQPAQAAPVAPAAPAATTAPRTRMPVPGRAPAPVTVGGQTGQTQDTGIPVWVWLAGATVIGITAYAFLGKGKSE